MRRLVFSDLKQLLNNQPLLALIFLFCHLLHQPRLLARKPQVKKIRLTTDNGRVSVLLSKKWTPGGIKNDSLFAYRQLAPGRVSTIQIKAVPLPARLDPRTLYVSTLKAKGIQKKRGLLRTVKKVKITGMDHAFYLIQSPASKEAIRQKNISQILYAYKRELYVVVEMHIPLFEHRRFKSEMLSTLLSLEVK